MPYAGSAYAAAPYASPPIDASIMAGLFANRQVLAVPAAWTFNFAFGGLESQEPNPNAATKTMWFEIAVPDFDITSLRVAASATGSTVKVAVFRQTDSALDSGAEASLTNLQQTTLGTDVYFNHDSTFSTYYVQVGLTAGTGDGTLLTIADATPPEGGTFANPQAIIDEWGYSQGDTTNAKLESGEPVPPGVTATASSWWLWTAPSVAPSSITFSVPGNAATGNIGLRAYTGTALGSLVAIATSVGAAANGVSITFTPTAGVNYYIQITVESDANIWELAWTAPSTVTAPAPVYDYLRVEVYEKNGTTKITEVPRRKGVEFNDPLNTVGSGQMMVPLDDDIFTGYPKCLDTGNIVKFFLGDKCVQGFRIQDVDSVWIADGEASSRWMTVSGPTLMYLLNDFSVYHDGGIRPDSPGARFFSWASRKGDWYDANVWSDQVSARSQTDPPGNWKRPPDKRDKWGEPKRWPDTKSKWLWASMTPDKNEPTWTPTRPIRGQKYYRKDFKIEKDGTPVRLFVTADEDVFVYLDGDLVLERKDKEDGYKGWSRVSTVLSAGTHTVAIFCRSRASKGGDGVDAMMFTMYELRKDGSKKDVIVRSNASWKAYYGDNPPGWNKAHVLRRMVFEARDRSNFTAENLSFGFDGDADSHGQAWPKGKFNREVKVGSSVLDLQAQLSEGNGFDVWVDPADLKLHAWRRRGQDKSASVALVPGANLLNWSIKTQDRISNVFLVQYEGGFFTIKAPGSIAKHGEREAYVELGSIKDKSTAREIMRGVIQGLESAMRKAGSPDIIKHRTKDRGGALIGVEGCYPFLDFTTGDIIAAPEANGKMVPMRVLDIACREDDDGKLTFDPVLDQVSDAVII